MTGMITLSDGGQNYIEFDIICDVISAVRPARLAGWVGTRVLNKAFFIGGRLAIALQWDDYNFPLKYPIVAINIEEIEGSDYLLSKMSADPSYYVNPSTGMDHYAYVAEINDVPLYFDCISAAAVAAANALLRIDIIPDVLMSKLDGIQLVGEPAPSGPTVIANIDDRLMTVFGNFLIDAGIIAHEATHAWAQDKWGSTKPPADTDYMAAINSGEPPVSEYAGTSPGEDIAEAVRLYVMDPETLKDIAPLRYAIIQRLMTDPGYYG